jgi:NAD(P) transhydrogenase subunit alpha
MIMSPAGTIQPARVLIVGVGVAGLQAIATAKRLGARVEAYDTRPETAEQIESLGAKAVKLDIGETGTTDRGYAKELTDEQKAEQQRQLAKVIANADVLITTAALFGRKPPQIVNAGMVAGMRAGSVIVDMAVSADGGNVAGSKLGQEVVTENGVTIIGLENFPAEVAINASQVYSANLTNLVLEFWDKDTKAFKLKRDDEIIKGCLVTHDGELVNDFIKSRRT